MSTFTGALRAGSHLWLAMEGKYKGDTITVDAKNKPAFAYPDPDNIWVKIEAVIGVDPSSDEEEITASRPNAKALIEPYDKEIISSEQKYTFDLESYDAILHGIQFRTKADQEGVYVRGSNPAQNGWMHWQAVNKHGEVVKVVEEYCSFKVTAGKWDGKDFIKPTLEATALSSPHQVGIFNPEGITG
ncbi:MAG: hypothetical protein GX293_13635 [Bacteroidales bacterium]|jgi:hypothetical protein|nr:hypothetical protein [Bacteroidales bacterium]